MKSPAFVTLMVAFSLRSGWCQEQLPKEAATLKEQYERALEAASQPITKRYLQELTALQQRYTKAGDLASAQSVKTMIESVSGAVEQEGGEVGPSRKALLESLDGTVWKGSWQYGQISLAFKGTEATRDPGAKWQRVGKLEVPGSRKIRVTLPASPGTPETVHELEMSKDGATLSGNNKLTLTKTNPTP